MNFSYKFCIKKHLSNSNKIQNNFLNLKMDSNQNNNEAKAEEEKKENQESDKKNDAPPQIIDSRILKIGDYQLHVSFVPNQS